MAKKEDRIKHFLCALVPLLLIVLVTACSDRPATSATNLIATPTVIQDAWTEVRVALPEDIPVIKPTWMPARFGPPALLEVYYGDQYGPRYTMTYNYTIAYTAPDEQIVFILGQGAGAWGNAPPPDTLEPLTVHGMNGVLHISAEAKFIGVSWLQQGRPYQIKSISAHVTREEMRQIVDSLTAVRPFTPTRASSTPGTPAASPSATALPPVTDWRTNDLPELGVQVRLPANWRLSRGASFYLAGPVPEASPPNTFPSTWLQFGFLSDVPQALPELEQVLERQWADFQIPGYTVTTPRVGGFESVAYWWVLSPHSPQCVRIFTVAFGLVHFVEFSSALCEADGKHLNNLGMQIVDSLVFSRASRPW